MVHVGDERRPRGFLVCLGGTTERRLLRLLHNISFNYQPQVACQPKYL
uniref:Uncharacterized protein n=1 Tax=Rhizophora mucronata TaxID=61149 RepID=A0A2P2MYX7_RHIMU